MRAQIVAVGLVIGAGCTGGDDGSSGGTTHGEDCGLMVAINSATCRFEDNPDPFDTDWWIIDASGTAVGLSTEYTSSQFYVETADTDNELSYSNSETCASWPNCVKTQTESESLSWTATLTNFSPSTVASHTFTVRAVSTKFGSTYCMTPTAVAEMQVPCTK